MLKLGNCSEPVWFLKLLGPALVYCLFLCLVWENGWSYAAPYITDPRNLLGRADCLWKVFISSDCFRLCCPQGYFIQLKRCSACEIPGSWWCSLVSFMYWPNSTQMHLSLLCRQRGIPGTAAPCQQRECQGSIWAWEHFPSSRRLQLSLVRVSFMHFESFQATVVEPSLSALCVWYDTKLYNSPCNPRVVTADCGTRDTNALLFSLKHCKQHWQQSSNMCCLCMDNKYCWLEIPLHIGHGLCFTTSHDTMTTKELLSLSIR